MNYLVENSTGVPIGETFGSPFGQTARIGDLVSVIITSSFVISGIILLFFFVIGGISLISGAGNDNPESVEKGKKAVTSALIGFIIIFVAYWLIRIIEVISGSKFVTGPGL